MRNETRFKDEDAISKEFDLFIKRSLEIIVRNVMREYVTECVRNDSANIDDMEGLLWTEDEYGAEKIRVQAGNLEFPFDSEILAEGYQKLKERHRIILGLIYAMDLPYKAVCELTNLQKKSVENYKSEALKILRRYCEEKRDAGRF